MKIEHFANDGLSFVLFGSSPVDTDVSSFFIEKRWINYLFFKKDAKSIIVVTN